MQMYVKVGDICIYDMAIMVLKLLKLSPLLLHQKWHEGHIEIISILKHRTMITQLILLNLAVTEVNVEFHTSVALLVKR